MKICHFTAPSHLMEYFQIFHEYFLESRTLEQTMSILLKYAIGYTKDIPLNEIVMIEEFFDRREYLFSEFLHCVAISLYTEEKFI